MSKLPKNHTFIDISDYSRPVAKQLVKLLLPTCVGAITLTWSFVLVSIVAIISIYHGHFYISGILLLLKSMLDAADGEMARARERPSYVGRYFDSISDLLINFSVLFIIAYVSHISMLIMFLTWLSLQLQGTVYNFYYCIKRSHCSGDKTSRINETQCPVPYPWESEILVKILHKLYLLLYGWQDAIVRFFDSDASLFYLPNYFLTLTSSLGLGSHIFLMALCLFLGKLAWIFIIILCFGNFIAVLLIVYRKYFLSMHL